MPNFVTVGQTVAEIRQFFLFLQRVAMRVAMLALPVAMLALQVLY